MFRMIALVRTVPDADIDDLVARARAMADAAPQVIAAQVMPGLRLLDSPEVPHASYSLLLDFEDEAAWREYLAGAPHIEFNEHAGPYLVGVQATQYVIDED